MIYYGTTVGWKAVAFHELLCTTDDASIGEHPGKPGELLLVALALEPVGRCANAAVVRETECRLPRPHSDARGQHPCGCLGFFYWNGTLVRIGYSDQRLDSPSRSLENRKHLPGTSSEG